MGRSNNVDIQNPTERYYRWIGGEKKGEGFVSYWDKDLGAKDKDGNPKGEEVRVDLPFKFLILENMSTIGGGRDEGDTYLPYRANAVKNTDLKRATFTLRSKHGIEKVGSYDEIKTVVGTKFVTRLLIAVKGDEGLEVAALDLGGAALNSWIDFSQKVRDIYEGAFLITGAVKKKKGSNEYFAPLFDRSDVPAAVDAMATQLHARVIVPYLDSLAGQEQEAFDPVADSEYTGPSARVETSAEEDAGNAWMDTPSVAPTGVAETAAVVLEALTKGKAKAKAAAASAEADPAFVTEAAEPGDDKDW